jgi:hypothetical protein
MKDINYPYFSGVLEGLLRSLPFDMEYNDMSAKEKSDYIIANIKRCEEKAIEYNKPLCHFVTPII